MGARRSLPSREKSRFNETFDPSHGSVCYEKELLVTRVQSPQGRKKVFKRRIILEIIVKWDPGCSNVNGIVINSKHRGFRRWRLSSHARLPEFSEPLRSEIARIRPNYTPTVEYFNAVAFPPSMTCPRVPADYGTRDRGSARARNSLSFQRNLSRLSHNQLQARYKYPPRGTQFLEERTWQCWPCQPSSRY